MKNQDTWGAGGDDVRSEKSAGKGGDMTLESLLLIHAKKGFRLSVCGLTPELGLMAQTSLPGQVTCPVCLSQIIRRGVFPRIPG